MMRSLWISKTGMEAQQLQLDTISNNLANVSTNGYKRSHAVFEDLMYQNLRQAGAASSEQTSLPTGLQVGLGTRAVATARNLSQGNLQQSSNNLDVAIRGNGLFEIQLPDGTPATPATAPSRSAPQACWSPTTATPSSPASPSRRRPRA
jgi:flagellar basal-body rod protein FlgG